MASSRLLVYSPLLARQRLRSYHPCLIPVIHHCSAPSPMHAMAAASILDSGGLFTVEEARPRLWEGDALILPGLGMRLLFFCL